MATKAAVEALENRLSVMEEKLAFVAADVEKTNQKLSGKLAALAEMSHRQFDKILNLLSKSASVDPRGSNVI
jgi:hypothetical protein